MKKVVSGVIGLLLFLISMLMLAYNIKQVKAEWTGTVYIRANGSIDPPDAPITSIDNVTYYVTDNIVVSYLGGIIVEKRNTVVDGQGFRIRGNSNYAISVNAINVTIKNFEIIGGGINVEGDNCVISHNNISQCFIGIHLKSFNNLICYNNLSTNSYGIYILSGFGNRIYHNNFVDNANHALTGSGNYWDNGYPSGGNYWSDYRGADEKSGVGQNQIGSDGIGDTAYFIEDNYKDNYPLMAPLFAFNAGSWGGIPANVYVASNSTVSNFQINTPERVISFNVTGMQSTVGFCRITVPNILVQDMWQGNFTILFDSEPWPFRNWTDSTNTYIYITYNHSEHEIVIIPEFPLTMILPLFMLTTLITTVLLMKKRKIERKLS
jgi:hypothetical protein